MVTKTHAEIVEFALNPTVPSLNAQVDDCYLSLVKVPVGKAVYVYGVYGFNPNFIEETGLLYNLGAIVANGTVYVFNDFNFFGRYYDKLDEFPHVIDSMDFFRAIYEEAQAIFRDWYAQLSVPTSAEESLKIYDFERAKKDFIEHGRGSNTFAEAPKRQDPPGQVVIQTLTGAIELKPYLLQQFEAERDEYIDLKTLRFRLLEVVRRGGDLPEMNQTIADAIRDVDAQMFTLTLEHDGLVRECKYGKHGFQNSLLSSCLETGYLTFKTDKEADELSEAFCGKRYERIPLSYISKITFKGKVLYARKDED